MCSRRRLLLTLAAATVVLVAPAAAQNETRRARDRRLLFERLRNAASHDEGRRAEDDIWRMWMEEAPTPSIAGVVAEAMRRREQYDWDGALALLDRVVRDAPGYAEGWNQRAFIRFLKQDFDGSLEDIERVLALEPLHFAALAGRAVILMRQGRIEPGQRALRQAVEIHPWLKERSMLVPKPGSDLPGLGRDI